MFFNSLKKKIPVDSLVYPWNIGLTCGNCRQQFTVLRRKVNNLPKYLVIKLIIVILTL